MKKIILSMLMLGLLGSHCIASQLSESQKAELMKFTIPPNGASYQFDDTKERLALVETDETLLNKKLNFIGALLMRESQMYLQFGQNLKPKEILFGPNLLAFIEKNKSKNIGLTNMLSAYENGLKNQAHKISITEKLNFIHTKIKNKEDIKADLFLKNDLVPEFHNVDEKQNKDISNILIYTLNNNQYLYDNKELFKNIVTRYPSILSSKVPEAVLDNEALILELIEKNLVTPNATQNSYITPSFNYSIFPESIKNNKKVVIALVNKLKNTPLNDVLINFVGKEMYKDKDFAKLLSNSIITGKNLQMIDMFSKNIREDEDIAFNFVKISGPKALQYLPSSLRENKKFMLKCLQMDKKAFEFVSEKLKDDDDIRVYKY